MLLLGRHICGIHVQHSVQEWISLKNPVLNQGLQDLESETEVLALLYFTNYLCTCQSNPDFKFVLFILMHFWNGVKIDVCKKISQFSTTTQILEMSGQFWSALLS